MKELIAEPTQTNDVALELGKVLGQSIAFGTVAGRCSAAQAAAIRQARTEKVHIRFNLTWKEFCPRHLKMSGSQADTFIRLLEEFGPDYFEHTQSVRISAATYRLIAPHIKDKKLEFQGETLELNSASVQKVADAVRETQPLLPAPEPSIDDRVSELGRHANEFLTELRAVSKACRTDGAGSLLKGLLMRTSSDLHKVLLENGIV